MSCHHTKLLHLSTHCFSVSLNTMRSSLVERCAIRVHVSFFYVASQHSQIVSLSKYRHSFLGSLLPVYLVLNLLTIEVPPGEPGVLMYCCLVFEQIDYPNACLMMQALFPFITSECFHWFHWSIGCTIVR